MKNPTTILLKKSISLLILTAPILSLAYYDANSQKWVAENAVCYPIMFLKGNKNIDANPEKAFNLLKDIKQIDDAKIWLAYCHFEGLGTPKDEKKADEILSKIKNFESIKNSIDNFANYKSKNLDFAVKLADIYYAKSKNFEDSYSTILEYSKQKDSKLYDKLIKISKEDSNTYANISFKECLNNSANYKLDKAVQLLPKIDIKDSNINHHLKNLLVLIIADNKSDLVKPVIEFYNNNNITSDETKISTAYCNYAGFGIKKNKDKAIETLENLAKNTNSDNILNSYYSSNLIKNTDGKKFCADFLNILSKNGKKIPYINALLEGKIIEKDESKAVVQLYDIQKSGEKINNLAYMLSNINIDELSDDAKVAVYNLIKNNNKTITSIYGNLYLKEINLILKGIGTKADPAKAFEYANKLAKKYKVITLENYNKSKLYCQMLEYMAYFYDNAIGVAKDKNKAVELRKEIDDIIADGNSNNIYTDLMFLYTKNSALEDAKMCLYYEKKSNDLSYKQTLNKLSPVDKKMALKYIEIAKLAKDDSKENLEKANKLADELTDELIASKSGVVNIFNIYELPISQYVSENLNEIHFSIILKCADAYLPQKYQEIANSYYYGHFVKKDLRKAIEYYKKYFQNNPQNTLTLHTIANTYAKLKDFDGQKETIEQMEKLKDFPKEFLLANQLNFYSTTDSKYQDIAKANKIFADLLKEISSINCMQTLRFINVDNLLQKNYHLKLSQKTLDFSDTVNPRLYQNIYSTIADSYKDGILNDYDIQKYIDFKLKQYENYNPISELEFYSFLIDNLDEKALVNTIDKALKTNRSSYYEHIITNLVKAILMDNNIGYPKDEKFIEKSIKDFAQENLLRYLMSDYAYESLKPSKEIIQKLISHTDTEKAASVIADAYYRIGNIDKALKFAKLDAKNSNYNDLDIIIELLAKTKSPQELAKLASQSEKTITKILYGSFLYNGFGVDEDKNKALEIFKKVKKDNKSCLSYLTSRAWLWKFYKENNQPDNAKKILDDFIKCEKTNCFGVSAISLALVFANNETQYFSNYPNIEVNLDYSNEILDYIQENHFDKYYNKLLDTYTTNPYLKDDKKKAETIKKAKQMLSDYTSK